MFFKLFGYLFGIGTVAAIAVGIAALAYVDHVSDELPEYSHLETYEPKVTTRIHAVNGTLLAEYAEEPRLYLPAQAIPDRVKQAFISAEDKMFYQHGGINFWALGKVGLAYVKAKATGKGMRLRGASTITQQVAKNFLLSDERSVKRKTQEALLAMRLEKAFSKEKILELYLNRIYFGRFPRHSYGIASAALAYFDKRVQDLTIEEAAYLAALPKAPNNYHPFEDTDRATERRDWVIGRMHINGYITAEEEREAKAKPLAVNPSRVQRAAGAGYFLEEARRRIVERYGRNKLFQGGLSVRTTLDLKMQAQAREALTSGLRDYDRDRGWRGPVKRIDVSGIDLTTADWGPLVSKVPHLRDVPEWRLAIVLTVDAETATLGLKPRRELSGKLEEARKVVRVAFAENDWLKRRRTSEGVKGAKGMDEVVRPGDVVYVSNEQIVQKARTAFLSRAPSPSRAGSSSRCRRSPARWWRWTRIPAA